MAASGYTPISLYYSTTASAVPLAANLANGEVALNTADMKLYAKNSSGVVTLLASNAGASGSVTSVAATVPTFLSITGSPITTSGTLAISLSGTALPTTSGGTGLTSFTSGGVVYASSSSALATGSALVFDGTQLGVGGSPTSLFSVGAGTASSYTDVNINGASTSNYGPYQSWASGGTKILEISSYGRVAGGTSTDSFITTVGSIPLVLGTNRTIRFQIGTAGQLGIGGATYGTSGQVLTSGGASAAPTWTTPTTGTVTSITVAAGTGMSGGGTVTTSGTVTLTNAGVTSVTAGTGISVSASTGGVTITSTASGGTTMLFCAFSTVGTDWYGTNGL